MSDDLRPHATGAAALRAEGLTDVRAFPSAATLPGAAALFYRFPNPWILTLKAVLFAAARPFLGPIGWWDLAILGAIAIYWPFQEWAAHVFILHLRPRKIGRLRFDPRFARVHRAHHREPWIVERTFVPTHIIVSLIPVNLAFWWLITPTPGLAATGIAGFTFAALVYEWIHYLVHTPRKPRSRWFRRVWKNHRLHHFKNERYWHAFAAPIVDRIFGTAPDHRQVEISETVRTLGVADELGEA